MNSFETFPRGPLAMKFGRRDAVRVLTTRLRVRERQREGEVARSLPELGSLADELLELMSPVLAPGGELFERDKAIWRRSAEGPPLRLFAAERPAAIAISRFDGSTPLGHIAQHLATEMAWPVPKAFAHVRGLFLHLVSLELCAPR